MFYSVVLLDGKELHCLTLEEVQDLFFKRQINQTSLVCDAENPQWQMLKRAFDLSQWISNNAPPLVSQNASQPQINPFQQTNQVVQPPINPFEQANPANQPITFNQFPPNHSNNNFGQNGYSQNNQTETYYQAETSQTDYNFQNNQPNIAPSKYGNAGNSYSYAPNFSQNSSNSSETRRGLRPAAVFLLVNAAFYVAYLVIGKSFGSAETGSSSEAYNAGRTTGAFLPLIIDLVLAFKLWKLDDAESARKWVLVRSYFGFIVFGLIIPAISFSSGEMFVGVFSFIATFFYFISLALVLHGKENPSPSRVVIGMGTFAIYFLVMFGTISLSLVGSLAPSLAKFNIENQQFEKYKIEGKEFEDKTTGAKVVLPEGWSMISLNNPIVNTPEARMIAVDNAGNRLTMLEVVPVPAQLDMKRQSSAQILDLIADGVVKAMNENVRKQGGLAGGGDFKEITRLSIFIGKHPAKLLVIDKTEQGEKLKGHLIITYDELTFYALHSWCPASEYNDAQNDFTFFEKNFSVPEKINSTYTQTAETLKK